MAGLHSLRMENTLASVWLVRSGFILEPKELLSNDKKTYLLVPVGLGCQGLLDMPYLLLFTLTGDIGDLLLDILYGITHTC